MFTCVTNQKTLCVFSTLFIIISLVSLVPLLAHCYASLHYCCQLVREQDKNGNIPITVHIGRLQHWVHRFFSEPHQLKHSTSYMNIEHGTVSYQIKIYILGLPSILQNPTTDFGIR